MTLEALALPEARPANDNARASPVVRVARGRSKAVYARSGDVLLPLRFARRMVGWRPA